MNYPKIERNLQLVALVLVNGRCLSHVAKQFAIHQKTAWEVVHAHCFRVDPGYYQTLSFSASAPPLAGASPAFNPPAFFRRPTISKLREHHAVFTFECFALGYVEAAPARFDSRLASTRGGDGRPAPGKTPSGNPPQGEGGLIRNQAHAFGGASWQ